jgi:small subunit ribosomal protein S1
MKPEGYRPVTDHWEALFTAKERGTVLTARVAALDYPNDLPTWVLAFDDFDGVRGLVPASETDLPDPGLMRRFVGQVVNVKIKGLDKDNKLVACSRRDAVAEARERLSFAEGQVLECTVRAVLGRSNGKPARLLVDVGGGLLVEIPRQHAALRLAQPLAKQFRIGETVTAKVTAVNNGLPTLSLRAARPDDSWERADFRRGAFISGTVYAVRETKDGRRIVFVEPDLAPAILGIAPYPLEGDVHPGDRVNCAVASFSREKRKLRLRLRGW